MQFACLAYFVCSFFLLIIRGLAEIVEATTCDGGVDAAASRAVSFIVVGRGLFATLSYQTMMLSKSGRGNL